MKDITKEQLESYKPREDALWLVNFCLDALYDDTEHGFYDKVNRWLTFEELIGALLVVRDEILIHEELKRQIVKLTEQMDKNKGECKTQWKTTN